MLRELTEHYDTILKTYNCGELLKLTMSIYAKKQEAETQKRRLGAVDESFLHRAEDLLFSEPGRCFGVGPGAGAALHCQPGWKPLGSSLPQ